MSGVRSRARQRVLSVSGGGGGGPAPSGNVVWGPRFGKADDRTFIVEPAASLEDVELSADLAVTAALSLDGIDLDFAQSQAAVDVAVNATVALKGDLAVASAVAMDTLALSGELGVTAAVDTQNVTMDADTLAVDAAVSGTSQGPPEFIDVATAAEELGLGDGTITVTQPGTVQDDDLLVAFIFFQLGTTTITPDQSGWTTIGSEVPATGSSELKAFYRIVQPGDPTVFDFSRTVNVGQSTVRKTATLCVIRFFDSADPIDVSAFDSGDQPDDTVPIPSVTTTNDRTLKLAHCVVESLALTPNVTFTPPTGYTETTDFDTGGATARVETSDAWRIQDSAGASGSVDFTMSDDPGLGGMDYRTCHVAINPDPNGVTL